MLREVRRLGKVWCARGSHVCVRGGESEQATRRREEERARPHVAEGKRDTDVEGEARAKGPACGHSTSAACPTGGHSRALGDRLTSGGLSRGHEGRARVPCAEANLAESLESAPVERRSRRSSAALDQDEAGPFVSRRTAEHSATDERRTHARRRDAERTLPLFSSRARSPAHSPRGQPLMPFVNTSSLVVATTRSSSSPAPRRCSRAGTSPRDCLWQATPPRDPHRQGSSA